MKTSYHNKPGFTLIELMIVVAIIGILSAVAIPTYTSYVNRAKITEAITLLHTMKTELMQEFLENGEFPKYLYGVETLDHVYDPEGAKHIHRIHYNRSTKVEDNQAWFYAQMKSDFNPSANVRSLKIYTGCKIIGGEVKCLCGKWSEMHSGGIDINLLPPGCKETGVQDKLDKL